LTQHKGQRRHIHLAIMTLSFNYCTKSLLLLVQYLWIVTYHQESSTTYSSWPVMVQAFIMVSKQPPSWNRWTGNWNHHSKTTKLYSNHHPNDAGFKIHENAFQQVAREVVKNDSKSTNIELANRGLKFSTYQKRLDYMQHPCHDATIARQCSSLWKNCISENINVREFLQAVGLDHVQATSLAQSQVIQQYCQLEKDNKDTDPKNHQREENGNEIFAIQTIQGLDLFKMTIEQVAKYNRGCGDIAVEHKWEGNTFVSEAFFLHENYSSKVFYRMERQLQCRQRLQDYHHDYDECDPLVMVVNSTLFTDGQCLYQDRNGGEWGVPSPFISCSQIFVMTWNDQALQQAQVKSGGNRMMRGSPVQRVPGCVANVNVRTLLVPIGDDEDNHSVSYQVLMDGESDAALSRGLLSVLRQALSSMNVQSILAVDPGTVADQLGLRNILSKGRNDGLASMMTVVQNQIRNLLSMTDLKTQSLEEIIVDSSPMINQSTLWLGNQSVENKPTVAMLLSGGVDSSVALNLLVRQGYNVTAFYLKIWLEDELAHLGQCPWEDDYRVCTQVCQQIGVPLESISLQNEYKEKVISYTINEAKKGRTPNPDIMCNSRVKFGCFYDAISQRNFDHVATGHYAQLEEIQHSDGTIERKLLRAPDPIKDQSYFLAALTQEQLSKVLFPIGQFEKSRVRELANEYDLPNKNRPDSQGLCFLGKVKFDEFLAEYLGTQPGDIIDAETNNIIGRHKGIWYHTVGQRKGLGKVLDPIATSRGPWYVVAKDTTRRLIIASNQYDEERFDTTRREFFVEDIRWITRTPPSLSDLESGVRLSMKIRHGPTIVNGSLQVSNKNPNSVELGIIEGKITLDKKDGGLAPGQFVVFYDGVECLGSAVISEKHWLALFQSEESLMSM